jgi:cellulose synthase/poly-beta-1,6-N-acetylglucosamine synthase-like glycosyltransferase
VETVLGLAVVLLVYTYAGYPALVAAWARLRPRPVRRAPIEPAVSVVVVVHNEESQIVGRLENILALDYPPERLEVLVASDGSTDATVSRAQMFGEARLEVIEFRPRQGKPAVLNVVVPRARGEIVILVDARQRFEREALRALVAPFADPTVGAVSGELMLAIGGPGRSEAGVGFYWHYEKFIRRHESLVDSTLGATGALYAIRRQLFTPMPADTLLDDVVTPARILRQGYRVVFEPAARAWDAAAAATAEFRRKTRTIAGNFQLFARERWLLDPRANRIWLQSVSHKGLRLVGPLLLLAAFAANAALVGRPGYAVLLGAQVAFYALAVAGAVADRNGRRVRILAVPYVFCVLQAATVVAFIRFVRRRQRVTWDKVAPAPPARVEDRAA